MVLSKQNLLIEVKSPGNTLLKDQGFFLNRETKRLAFFEMEAIWDLLISIPIIC